MNNEKPLEQQKNSVIEPQPQTAGKKKYRCILKYIWLGIGGLLLLLLLGIGGYLIWFFNFRKVPPPPDYRLVLPHVKNGDVLLRYGVGLWSEIFRISNPTDKRFSHVGIVVEKSPGNFVVVHAEGSDITGKGAVWEEPFDSYVTRSISVGIARPHAVSGDLLAEKVQKFIGQPFDCKFNTKDHSEIYCTELVDLALKEIDPNIALKIDGLMIKPEACMDKKYFTEITLP